MRFSMSSSGSWDGTEKWIEKVSRGEALSNLDRIGRAGVSALASRTPKESTKTANSWEYQITRTPYGAKVTWVNTNVVDGANIAILIQYGHGTGTGGYVQGFDYINPPMRPIFKKAIDDVMKEVLK